MAGMGMKGIRNEVHRPWRTGHQFSLASAACHSRVPSHLVCLCPSRLEPQELNSAIVSTILFWLVSEAAWSLNPPF